MQDSRINYVVVGGFVVALLAAFIVVITMLAGRGGATDEYFTVYKNVGGVKYGTMVFYEGYQIGQVKSIEPQKSGQDLTFKVTLQVQRDWIIPSDSLARSMVSGLLSAVAIDIRGGKSQTILKPGSEIKGQEAGNFFATLADIGAEFGDLSTNSIRPLIDNVNAYVKQLSDTTANNLPTIMANLNKLSGTVDRTAAAFEQNVLSKDNLQHIDSIIASADRTAVNLSEVSKGLDETRKLLNQSIQSVNKVVDNNSGNVDEAMRDFRYTLDTLARYIDDISHNADSTARNMAEFSRSIRENPGLLLGGSSPPDQANEKPKGERK